MTKRAILALALAALALSACAQLGGGVVGKTVAKFSGVRAMGTAMPPIDTRTTVFAMLDKGFRFSAVPIEKDGDVTIWAAQDGSQIGLRNGMVISTRGFGADLMSAQVPSVADLLDGTASHKRVFHVLDGADSPQRRSFDCTVSRAPKGTGPATAHHIAEVCQGPSGRFANEFWIDSARTVVESRQWLGESIGRIAFRRDGQ